MAENKPLKNKMLNDLRFLKGWFKHPRKVGSITPTSKAAARMMVSLVPDIQEQFVLELGPGTGPITKAILETGIDSEKLVSIEYDVDFYNNLLKKFRGVNFINGDAFDLENSLGSFSDVKFGAIFSGIPLLNFPREQRVQMIEQALKFLQPGAPFIQLCYGPNAPVSEMSNKFSAKPSKWVVANIPPARFWIYRSTKAIQ